MTPAEHYAEAERILEDIEPIWDEFMSMPSEDRADGLPEVLAALEFVMARAQVHATLATCLLPVSTRVRPPIWKESSSRHDRA